MTVTAQFEVDVGQDDARAFAELSGDHNPLHTDPAYAATTAYGRPVLHGAFSAGLLSRMAGMHLPGRECLLHGLRLRFLAPILPPARLRVVGQLVSGTGEAGRVDVTVSDRESAVVYVRGSYDFGLHEARGAHATGPTAVATGERPVVLVTGASGGLGGAVLARLGDTGLGSSRSGDGLLEVPDLERVSEVVGRRPLSAIVHCAWPKPGNVPLLGLDDPSAAVEAQVAQPLRQMLALARCLADNGTPDAILVLVGSTFADPGRHGYRMPLYSLAKSMIPTLVRALAVELAPSGRRCAGVSFDVVDGGMNAALGPRGRITHADRVPSGRLPSPEDAAAQVAWLLDNRSTLVSGAMITLSGGALP